MVSNVRSLLNKYDEASSVIVANDVDLVAVTETWLHFQVPDEAVSIPSFQLIRKDRTNDRRGGYIRDDIKCIHLADLEKDELEVLYNSLLPPVERSLYNNYLQNN